MIRVSENKDVVELRSRVPLGRRILFLALSIFPLLAPYELLLQPRWQSYANIVFVFAAVISLGALTVSAALAWAAIAGLSVITTFDTVSDTLTYTTHAPVLPRRRAAYPLTAVRQLAVEKHEWSDGAPTYDLVVTLANGPALKTVSSWSKEEIEEIGQRVDSLLDRATHLKVEGVSK